MKKPYTIRYLKTAEKDLLDIFDYIQKDSPSAALSQLEKFDKSISRLALSIYPRLKAGPANRSQT